MRITRNYNKWIRYFEKLHVVFTSDLNPASNIRTFIFNWDITLNVGDPFSFFDDGIGVDGDDKLQILETLGVGMDYIVVTNLGEDMFGKNGIQEYFQLDIEHDPFMIQ